MQCNQVTEQTDVIIKTKESTKLKSMITTNTGSGAFEQHDCESESNRTTEEHKTRGRVKKL